MESRSSNVITNIIRNIISEVVRECNNRSIDISAGLLKYYLNLLELDPNQGLTADYLTNREKAQHLVKQLVVKFTVQTNPQIVTLKLQQEFLSKFNKLEDTVSQIRRRLDKKLYPLLLDITEQTNYTTTEELYKKITGYITLASGLGNPANKPVFKEVIQVLKSVITPEEMEIFPSIQNYVKQELLKCLVDIVTGIRLYNKSCKKGGEEMGDIPKLVAEGIEAVKKKLAWMIEQAQNRVELITLFVIKYVNIRHIKEDYLVEINFKIPEEKKKWEHMRDMAVTYRQLVKITKTLVEYIDKLDDHRNELNEKFETTIEYLRGFITPTLYQAITEVFPYFTELSTLWTEFQKDGIRLKEIFTIFENQWHLVFTIGYDSSISDKRPYWEEWLEKYDNPIISPVSNPDIIIHTDTKRFTEKNLEFNGYCCWMITHTDGVLMPGIIRLGVVEYKNKFYAFSSKMAANSFIQNPDEYIMKTLELARKLIHLVPFLDITELMRRFDHVNVLVKKTKKAEKIMNNAEVQTDTHFQESGIDSTYLWNIWDYKKTMMKYYEVRNKKTKATGTDNTHQKESTTTQTYDHRSSETQTMRDNYINTSKPSNYFHGLRGYRRNYPFVVNLNQAQPYSQAPKYFK